MQYFLDQPNKFQSTTRKDCIMRTNISSQVVMDAVVAVSTGDVKVTKISDST